MKPIVALRPYLLTAASACVLIAALCHVCVDTPDEQSGPLATFRTQNLVVDQTSDLGGPSFPTQIHGPTRQTVTLPGAGYAYGEMNLENISGVAPSPPSDVFGHVIRNSVAFDTSGGPNRSGGIAVEVTSTRSAGANDLTNIAIECTARNSPTANICFQALEGDVQIRDNLLVTSGYMFAQGAFLAALGPVIAENAGDYAIYVNNAPTDTIRGLAANESWNARNNTASTIKLWNEVGAFSLFIANLSNVGVQIVPDGITGITAGTFQTASTTISGAVTGVGAVTTTITFA